MLKASNIHYEFDGRHQGISYGGIGLIYLLARDIGLLEEIDKNLELLKRHLPYHESDHAANMEYNILAGGACLVNCELFKTHQIIPAHSGVAIDLGAGSEFEHRTGQACAVNQFL